MPNRILKESVCTSDSINALTWFEEVVFYRLIVNCDDYGRMDAREAILRAKLFPLKERISNRDIKNAVVRLADTGCVRLYECDSKPYLYLPNWESHQSIRAKRSKYPAPEEDESIKSSARVSHMDVEDAVVRLADTGRARPDDCAGKPDPCRPNFELHQSAQSKRGEYPMPEEDIASVKSYESNCMHMHADDFNCMQMKSDDCICSRNPIQSISKSESESKNTDAHALHTRFGRFWSAYPKKMAKKAAERAFCRLKPDDALLETMLEALERQKQTRQWKRDGGQYIPYPATWINGRRWEDAPDRDPPDGEGGGSGVFQGIDLGIDEL